MDHAIIMADFCNVRNIQGRKCVQIVCEVPTEQAGRVLDILGWPDASSPKKVCIALMNEDVFRKEPDNLYDDFSSIEEERKRGID